MTAKIEGLYIGLPKTISNESGTFVSAIDKGAVAEAFLSRGGFVEDGVANKKFHGGPDRAVCVYAYEHYSFWEQEREAALPPPAFGENLSVTGMLERDVCIGDIFRIGEALVQVSQSRFPCYTISRKNEYPPLLSMVVESGYTGYFFRVMKEGWVRADSDIELVEKHPKQVSIFEANRVLFRDLTDASAVAALLDIEEHAEAWKGILRKHLAKMGK